MKLDVYDLVDARKKRENDKGLRLLRWYYRHFTKLHEMFDKIDCPRLWALDPESCGWWCLLFSAAVNLTLNFKEVDTWLIVLGWIYFLSSTIIYNMFYHICIPILHERQLLEQSGIRPEDIVNHLIHEIPLPLSDQISQKLRHKIKLFVLHLEQYISGFNEEGVLDRLSTQWLFNRLPWDEIEKQALCKTKRVNSLAMDANIEQINQTRIWFRIGCLSSGGEPDLRFPGQEASVVVLGDLDSEKVQKACLRADYLEALATEDTLWILNTTAQAPSNEMDPEGIFWRTQIKENNGKITVFIAMHRKYNIKPKLTYTIEDLKKLIHSTIEDTNCRICFSTCYSKMVCPCCKKAVCCKECMGQIQRTARSQRKEMKCPNCRSIWQGIHYMRKGTVTETCILKEFIETAEKFNLCNTDEYDHLLNTLKQTRKVNNEDIIH